MTSKKYQIYNSNTNNNIYNNKYNNNTNNISATTKCHHRSGPYQHCVSYRSNTSIPPGPYHLFNVGRAPDTNSIGIIAEPDTFRLTVIG